MKKSTKGFQNKEVNDAIDIRKSMRVGSMKKVIVLMSTYNGEKYLREQIDSILRQTYSHVELFVRDDGSTDSTKEILESYSEKGLLTWYQGENLKAALSFMDLVKKAPDAEYYAFADQDDYWYEDKIEIAVNKLEEIPENRARLYCSNPKLVDESLNPIPSKMKNFSGKVTFGRTLVQSFSPGCTFVFNAKARKYLAKYNESYILMHDSLLVTIISALGVVYFDETPRISYRQHSSNVIGIETNFLKAYLDKIYRFLFSSDSGNRYKIACAIEKVYREDLDENELEVLFKITKYKDSLKNRFKLLFQTEIRTTSWIDNIFFRFLVLLGKF